VTITYAPINVNTDSFGVWLDRTNALLGDLNTRIVTTNSNTTSGNAAISGTFTANVIQVTTEIVQNETVANLQVTTANVANMYVANLNVLVVNTNTSIVANAQIVSANVTSLTVNTATANVAIVANAQITSANVNSYNGNNMVVANANFTTANVATLKVTTINTNFTISGQATVTNNFTIALNLLKIAGGNTTNKFLRTDGSGNLTWFYPVIDDLSDGTSTINTLNTRITSVDASAIAYAIALG
jgi:hypothetical protein